jgi:two-component system, NarL family, nitrate/nitrite response regulator NarL
MPPVRILHCDDSPTYRALLRAWLGNDPRLVVAEAEDGEQAIAQARADPPDVIVLDNHMPRCTGLEALGRLRAAAPLALVYMLSSDADPASRRRAAEGGAAGWFRKGEDERCLRHHLLEAA